MARNMIPMKSGAFSKFIGIVLLLAVAAVVIAHPVESATWVKNAVSGIRTFANHL